MTRKKILILGGSGFLATNLAKKLHKLNFNIFLLCKKKNISLKKKNTIKYLFCDINNFQKLKKILKNINFEYVINLSGNINHNDKKQTKQTHFIGLKNIVKCLINKKIKLFIQAGSSLEYGNYNSPQPEKKNCKPISFYGKVKLLASRYLLSKKITFKVVILRMYQIYGPHQKQNRLIPHVITSCLKNKTFDCTSGLQIRDFLFVDDFSNLILKILKKDKLKSKIYNVGSGKPILIKKLVKKIVKIIGKGNPKFGALKMRKDETLNLYPNINKIKKEFKWEPKINLEKGLFNTIKFYEKKY